jgi:ADP-ribose pyrophosphatase YjhB (NUDIX family)
MQIHSFKCRLQFDSISSFHSLRPNRGRVYTRARAYSAAYVDSVLRDQPMKFCSQCANQVSLLIPPDDNRARYVCKNCGTIHYQNPKLVVGSIPIWDDGDQPCVLLCRRAIEPRHGFWTLPAGFMENGETTSEGAKRETMEEAGARVDLHGLFSMLNVAHVDQVHLFYRASLLDLDYAAGPESLEVKMFSEAAIPWGDIAFPTISNTLRFFFEDNARVREGGEYRLHLHDIVTPMLQEHPLR